MPAPRLHLQLTLSERMCDSASLCGFALGLVKVVQLD
jgi:hypothetical protein